MWACCPVTRVSFNLWVVSVTLGSERPLAVCPLCCWRPCLFVRDGVACGTLRNTYVSPNPTLIMHVREVALLLRQYPPELLYGCEYSGRGDDAPPSPLTHSGKLLVCSVDASMCAFACSGCRMDPLGEIQFQFLRIPMWTLPFAQMGGERGFQKRNITLW